MSKRISAHQDRDTMRSEYDFSGGIRGVTARRYARGPNSVVVTLDAGVRADGNCAQVDLWGQEVYEFVEGLREAPRSQGTGLFNPWYDTDDHDLDELAPEQRRLQLLAYLLARRNAPLVLIAEALGYQGGRFSGIAMTSERMLLGHHATVRPEDVLPVGFPIRRTSGSKGLPSRASRQHGFTEPTATTVWRALRRELDPFKFVLWNSVPWHPHRQGNGLSNRAPSTVEQAAGLCHVRRLLDLFPGAKVVAIGNKAQTSLAGLVDTHHLRHPANGGSSEFNRGVQRLVKQGGRAVEAAAIAPGRSGAQA